MVNCVVGWVELYELPKNIGSALAAVSNFNNASLGSSDRVVSFERFFITYCVKKKLVLDLFSPPRTEEVLSGLEGIFVIIAAPPFFCVVVIRGSFC